MQKTLNFKEASNMNDLKFSKIVMAFFMKAANMT